MFCEILINHCGSWYLLVHNILKKKKNKAYNIIQLHV